MGQVFRHVGPNFRLFSIIAIMLRNPLNSSPSTIRQHVSVISHRPRRLSTMFRHLFSNVHSTRHQRRQKVSVSSPSSMDLRRCITSSTRVSHRTGRFRTHNVRRPRSFAFMVNLQDMLLQHRSGHFSAIHNDTFSGPHSKFITGRRRRLTPNRTLLTNQSSNFRINTTTTNRSYRTSRNLDKLQRLQHQLRILSPEPFHPTQSKYQ